MSERIENFRDLRVYKHALELQQEIFIVTKTFPAEERYSLTDQIRRSSRSIGANLAEAWHKRRYIAHFVSKIIDADGENAETQHWLDTARRCEYLTSEQYDTLEGSCRTVGKMLGSMLANPEPFCHPRRDS